MELFYSKKNELLEANNNNYLTLYDSLDLMNKAEIVDSQIYQNILYCNKCKDNKKLEKKVEIYRTPYYLIIQLKRFKQKDNNNNNKTNIIKNETPVDYKEILDLHDFVVGPDKDKSIYDLYGVLAHKKSSNGGHYYSYCKNLGLWINFDDEKLSTIDSVFTKDAYLLFYKRRSYD